MKTLNGATISLLFLMLGLAHSFPAAAQITLHFNERPPYVFIKDGHLSGLIGAPAEAAFKAAGVQYTLALTPTARQLQIIKNNAGADCSASGWFKNEERESLGKFTKAVYRDKARIALSSARNTTLKNGETIESVLGSKGLHLLVKQGYSYGKVVDQLIQKQQPITISVAVENDLMLKMIQAGRADLMLVSQEEADDLMRAAGINAADIRKLYFSNAPNGEYRYIFCSKQVPDEIINRLNSALR